MTPQDVNLHLQQYLPRFTNLFTSLMAVSSANVTLGNVIVVNSAAHGLSTGNTQSVSSGTVRNSVNNVTIDSNGDAILTTDYDHDLITPHQSLDQKTIVLTGFTPAEWNYEANILENVNSTTLRISTPNTVVPTALGYFPGERNILGPQTITVIDVNSFSYAINYAIQIPVGPIDNMEIVGTYRMYVTSSLDRAEKLYTQQNKDKAALYVMFNDVDISKDRHTQTDLNAAFTPADFQLYNIMTNFEILVFLPTDDDIASQEAVNLCYGEIFRSLVPTFQGYRFQNDSAIPYVTTTSGHGPGGGDYNPAYYVHVYSWQAPETLTINDGFPVQVGPISVPFQEMLQTWQINGDPLALMSSGGDLR